MSVTKTGNILIFYISLYQYSNDHLQNYIRILVMKVWRKTV